MQITSLRLGLTRNLGNYESAKLEVEAVPSEGQKADETLAELHQFVAGRVCGIQGTSPPQHASTANATNVPEQEASAPAEEKPKKRKRGRPRKAKPAETKKPEPKPAADDVPFDADDDKPDLAVYRGGLKPQTSDGVDAYNREVRFTREAETLQELLDRFNELRDWGANYSTEQWEKDVTSIAQRYRELNTPGADVDTQDNLVAAFKAERTFIDNRRREENRIKQRAGKHQRPAA